MRARLKLFTERCGGLGAQIDDALWLLEHTFEKLSKHGDIELANQGVHFEGTLAA